MIDIDLNPVKILPSDHIALKDYDYVEGVAKKNKMLKNIILIGVTTLVIIITYKIYENEKRKKD